MSLLCSVNHKFYEKHEILEVIKQKMKLTFELFLATYAKMTKQDLGLYEVWPLQLSFMSQLSKASFSMSLL